MFTFGTCRVLRLKARQNIKAICAAILLQYAPLLQPCKRIYFWRKPYGLERFPIYDLTDFDKKQAAFSDQKRSFRGCPNYNWHYGDLMTNKLLLTNIILNSTKTCYNN